MKNRKIILYVGDIQTGKSEALLAWCKKNKALGFVTPTVNGKKVLYHLLEKQQFPYELATPTEGAIAIGRYFLDGEAFKRAYTIILQSFEAQAQWLVLDEIGKLELNQEGHHQAIEFLLHHSSSNLLFVVRTALLEAVLLAYFKEHSIQVITDLKEVK